MHTSNERALNHTHGMQKCENTIERYNEVYINDINLWENKLFSLKSWVLHLGALQGGPRLLGRQDRNAFL